MLANKSLIKKNMLGTDETLGTYGSNRKYLYSIGDGFRLLIAIRKNQLTYTREDSTPFTFNLGEEYLSTRENRGRVFISDPYHIDSFEASLEDDIKIITEKHTVDDHGVDQRAKNNLWTLMPKILVLPLLSGMHWRVIRVQINYDTKTADILYDDPYGGEGFNELLVKKIYGALRNAISCLISQHEGIKYEITTDSITTHKKEIDQQGRGENGYDCGPIAFKNIEDYTAFDILNEEFISEEPPYTVSLASVEDHEQQMKDLRISDIEVYNEVTGIEISAEKVEAIYLAMQENVEIGKGKLQIGSLTTSSIISKVQALSDGEIALIFEIINSKRLEEGYEKDSYTEDELMMAYQIVYDDDQVTKVKTDSVKTNTKFSGGIDLRLTGYDTLTAEGLRKSFHGNLYQLGLLTLTAYRANNKGKAFYLVSEATEFEKFDDLVVDYGESVTFLQAKHSSLDKGNEYSATDFCANVDGDASLAKYFDSWLRLRSSNYVKLESGELKATRYIFFTNRGVSKSNTFLEDYEVKNDEFLFKGLNTKTVRFKKGETRAKFITKVRAYSEEIKKVATDIDNIDLDNFEEEVSEAAKKLEKKLLELSEIDKKGQVLKQKKIYSSHGISTEAMAIIKLSREYEDFEDALLAKMPKISKELMRKYEQYITVNVDNPIEVLAKIMQKEIDEFLDQFIIKIEQPSHTVLMDVILQELKLDINIAPLEFYNALNGFMLNWFSERHGCLIKSSKISEFIDAKTGDLHRFYLLGSTKVYEKEYEQYPIDLDGLEIIKLYDFLNGDNFIALINGIGINPRVYRTIKLIVAEKELKDGDWSFLDITSPYLSELSVILKGDSTKFLIIDCHAWLKTQEELVKMMAPIFEATRINNKQLVLLVNNEQENYLYGLVEENIKVDQLTSTQLEKVCTPYDQKFLTLGGKQHKLFDILQDESSSMQEILRDLDLLCEVLKSLNSSATHYKLGLPYNVYIPNDFVEGIPYYDLYNIVSNVQVQLFIIDGVDSSDLIEFFKRWFNREGTERFSTSPASDNTDIKYRLIRNFSSISKCKEIFIYVGKTEKAPIDISYISLLVINDRERYVTVEENPIGVNLPMATGYDFTRNTGSSDLVDSIFTFNHFSILSAPAGFGKSSFCLDRRYQWLQDEESTIPAWVIRISLPSLDLTSTTTMESVFTKLATDNEWPQWQLKVLAKDMEIDGRVVLLLDALDEIKDDTQIPKLNWWINELPDTISILITTRPYAAHKITIGNTVVDRYVTLNRYTPEQHQEYITEYVRAIVRKGEATEVLDEEKLSDIAVQIYRKLTQIISDDAINLLGIPLESYIFCETLETHILVGLKTGNELDIDTIFNEVEILNTAILYQRFILTKLQLFLQKHMGIPLETTLNFPHRVYSLTASYSDILMAFAFKQAFQLEYEFISKALARVYYTNEMIRELSDTGLVSVESKDKKLYLRFIHETYQEYLTAVFLLKGVILEDTLAQYIEEIIINNRYNPQYRLIMSMAAQLSIVGDPLIPGFNKEHQEHITSFWRIICEKGDILEAASSKLFYDCLHEFSDDQKLKLRENVKDKKWALPLVRCIDEDPKFYEDYKDLVEDYNAELPVLIKRDTARINLDSKTDISKGQVAHTFKLLKQNGALDKKKIKKLAKVTDDHKGEGDYWALDGGLEAIGYTGKFFSKKLADYLILRAGFWANNEAAVILALGEIYKNLDAEDGDVAKKNCFYVLKFITNNISSDNENRFINLLNRVNLEFINYLIKDLKSELKLLVEKNFNIDDYSVHKLSRILEEPFEIMKSMLLVAERLQYAVIIEEDQIVLSRDIKITINLEENILSNIFIEAIFSILEKVRNLSDVKDWVNVFKLDNLDELSIYKIEHYFLTLLEDNDLFDQYFNKKGKLKDNVGELFELLSKHKLLNKHQVEKLIEILEDPPPRRLFWDADGGLEAIGYTGKFFNEELASHLITVRAWRNNKEKAILALKQIHSILTSIDVQTIEFDEDYHIAVRVYNECIKEDTFIEAELVAIKGIVTVSDEDEKKMSGEGALKLKEGNQEVSHICPFYNKYYKYGLEEILLLRLKDANIKDVTILPAFKLNVQTLKSILPLVAIAFDKGFNEVIVPCNIEEKHWVGLIFKINVDDNLDIVYLDSEQAGLTLDLEIQLIKHFKERGQEVVIIEEVVELQRYNNCGPELVENIVKHLGGTRVGQDESVMLHSMLYERAIIQTNQLKVVNHEVLQVVTRKITCAASKEESVLVTDVYNQQIIDEESSTIFTDLTHVTSELLSAQRQQILTESRVSRINRKEVDIDRNTKKGINIEVDGTWYSEFNIREYLKEINDKLEGYIVSWISPDRYKSMERLASKYGIKVKIKDEKGLEKAYKKLSLKTHPDKTIRLEEEAKIEAEVDFKKAAEIKEGREGNFNIAEAIYAPIISIVQKANLGIKVADASIEIIRATYDPIIGNVVKATTGIVTSSALYIGKIQIIKVTLPIDIVYKVYEGDYIEAIHSGISGISVTLAYSTVCATMPVLCMPLTIGVTVYSGYNMLENGYKLYNELFTEENEDNQLNIQNRWEVYSNETQAEYY